MRDALVELLDKVDIAVAESRGVLEASRLDEAAHVAAETRLRLSYPESIVLIALAGGTGSGKSSLLNAIAGEEVALTGGVRPMTVKPLALVPAAARESLRGYLEAHGIEDLVDHDGPSWMCLIDLPDNDSVEVDHRLQVETLLPRVDLVVWVTDPEKYRDASLHRGFIRPLNVYQRQFLFVLNQIDRIEPEDVGPLVGDMTEALVEDGIGTPEVIPMAAQPTAGPPIGVESLLQRLDERRRIRQAVHRKLLTDLASVASHLVVTSSGARGVEFERRWGTGLEEAVGLAAAGKVAEAGHDLGSLVGIIAEEAQGETGDRLRDFAEEVPSLFHRCMSETALHPEERGPMSLRDRLRRRSRRLPETSLEQERLEAEANRVIGDPIRDLLAQRGRAHAAIADLALSVGHLERRDRN